MDEDKVINNKTFRCLRLKAIIPTSTCISKQQSPKLEHISCHGCEIGLEIAKDEGIKINRKIKKCRKCGKIIPMAFRDNFGMLCQTCRNEKMRIKYHQKHENNLS